MTRICKTLFAALSLLVTVSAAHAGEVRLTEAQLAADRNASLLVRRIVDSIPDGTTLVFPKGTYHFYPQGMAPHFCAITNNDNGVKLTPFPLIGKRNVTVDGGGSDFIFHGVTLPFIVERSENITLRNFTIDWQYPFHLEGTVVANDQTAKTFDMRINDGFHYRVDGDVLKIVGEGWEVEGGQNVLWDARMHAPHYDLFRYVLASAVGPNGEMPYTAEDLGDRVVRIRGRAKEMPPVGSVYTDKGLLWKNRVAPAIRIFLSKNLTFTDITVYHAGAIGLIGEFCENVTLLRYNTYARPGGGRILSTTADATHFSNCRGTISIKDGVYRHMLDDATNVHGAYLQIVRAEGKTLWGDPVHLHRAGCTTALPGDRVRVIDNRDLQPVAGGTATVTGFEIIHDRLYKVTLDKDLSPMVQKGFGIENMSWNADLVFSGNKVYQNRARSILISTPGRVVVERNYFSSQMSAIQIAGDVNNWFESGAVNDVTIRDNTFGDSGYGGARGGSILNIKPEIIDPQLAAGKYFHRNIRFTGNTISCFEQAMVYASGVDGLLFENNTILPDDGFYQPLMPDAPVFEIVNCKGVVVRNNPGIRKTNLYRADPASREISITAE